MQKLNFKNIIALIFSNTWIFLILILLIELWLAYSIPPSILSNIPILNNLVKLFEVIVPIMRRITDETAQYPELIRFYILIILMIMPIKAWNFHRWLTSDYVGNYRHLVISPLTYEKPASGDFFITHPIRKEKNQKPKNVHRSFFSRVFWSVSILLFTVLMCWVLLEFGTHDSELKNIREKFNGLVTGGISMWSVYSLQLATLSSFLVAISICILRDYCVFFKKKISHGDTL